VADLELRAAALPPIDAGEARLGADAQDAGQVLVCELRQRGVVGSPTEGLGVPRCGSRPRFMLAFEGLGGRAERPPEAE